MASEESTFPVDRVLRAARRRADMSQRQLAAAAEVSRQVVARAEAVRRAGPGGQRSTDDHQR